MTNVSKDEKIWVRLNIQALLDILYILNEHNIDIDANELAHFAYLHSTK